MEYRGDQGEITYIPGLSERRDISDNMSTGHWVIVSGNLKLGPNNVSQKYLISE